MFDKLKRWWQSTLPDPPPQGPLPQLEVNDWVVVPYRVAEACRISIYTIGSHPELPDALRLWIAQWLAGYNGSLAVWFQNNYGPEIFPVLADITNAVRDVSEQVYADQYTQTVASDFDRWQQELHEPGGNDAE